MLFILAGPYIYIYIPVSPLNLSMMNISYNILIRYLVSNGEPKGNNAAESFCRLICWEPYSPAGFSDSCHRPFIHLPGEARNCSLGGLEFREPQDLKF